MLHFCFCFFGYSSLFFVRKFVPQQSKATQIAAAQMNVMLNIKAIFNNKNNLMALFLGVIMMMGHFLLFLY
jgi:predicted MFS family arabinose efflux permease